MMRKKEEGMHMDFSRLKKYDLHCHLDGSLSKRVILKLARMTGADLGNVEDLESRLRVREDCRSLKEYLEKFDLPLSCLTDQKCFTTAVTELMGDGAKENVVYMEIRFAPFLSVHESLNCKEIIEGALDGLKEGHRKYGTEGTLILCGMRHMPVEKNVELAKIAAEYRNDGVAALDLAGDEAGFPVTLHKEMFETAKKLGIPFTIHAGECGSVQSVKDAIAFGAKRIGHGIAIRKDQKLMEYCREHRIFLELCPTSNLQTKAIPSREDYPFMEFYRQGIPITVNTDNRTVSHTTITKELQLLETWYGLTYEDMEQLMKYAEEAAFRKE